jgi:RNA polymerase sigma-70 factor, ECF subfamily
MGESSMYGITSLLQAWSRGDDEALSKLTGLVYDDLDRLAHFYMAKERSGHILDDTGLIDETYLRLAKLRELDWKNRKHFYVVCSRLMQRILTDYARSELCQKRSNGTDQIPFDESRFVAQDKAPDLAALVDALEQLATKDERKAKVVQLRFFGGLSVAETAEVLAISARTVNDDWKFAKAWLLRELDRGSFNGH